MNRYPLGIQTFEKIREENLFYVDKTDLIYNIVKGSQNNFLSRPRRFGKSLLVTTMQAYFEGKKDLFKGLAIEKLEKEWVKYPVIHIDLSSGKYYEVQRIMSTLDFLLSRYELKYDITPRDLSGFGDRFNNIIQTAAAQTGQKVVVLIDEYDAPMLDSNAKPELQEQIRSIMRDFFSPLKANEGLLRFVFLTGITKFSQLSIFSELNNLKNISMMPEFAAICGMSEGEVRGQMPDYLDNFGSIKNMSREQALAALKRQYDGYHFAWPSPDIFNPFSLLNALQDRKLRSYWFESGTPTFLIEKLREFNISPSMLCKTNAMASSFDAPTENMTSVIPLLYQGGYFTIKDYDEVTDLYVLDVPNKEIRIGLMESLLPNYVKIDSYKGMTTVGLMYRALYEDNLDGMLRQLQSYLLTIPYCDNTNYEGHYQQLLYVIFTLLGRYVDVEVHTPTGRVDMVMNSGKAIYLFELKLDKSADAAMQQIELKDYASKFALSGLPVVRVGISFDAERRTIGEWKIEST